METKLKSPPRRRTRSYSTLAANVTNAVVMLQHGNRRFWLKEPIDLRVSREAGLHWVVYEPLRIFAAERDPVDALASFADDFAAAWDDLALEKDERLTRGARTVKSLLLKMVARVEVVAE